MGLPSRITRVILPAQPAPIHTERLLLRPMEDSDASGIFTIRSRQDVADWLWPKTPDINVQGTRDWMAQKLFCTPDGSGAIGRKFYFVITRIDDPTGSIIGMVGINALEPSPSIGYSMHPEHWNNGYATESVTGVLNAWWQLPRVEIKLVCENDKREEEIEKLYSACNKANIGSLKVLLKNGFKIYNEIPLEGDIVAFLQLHAPLATPAKVEAT